MMKMRRITDWIVFVVAVLLTASAVAHPAAVQGTVPSYTNLQVLPTNINQAELSEIMLANLQAGAFFSLKLDPLGWRLFRGGRPEPGVRVFELNYAEHPDAFVASESLAWAYQLSGDPRGIEIAEQWATAHPDHEGGRALLAELR